MTSQPDAEEVVCSECGRAPHSGENPDDDWRVESDGMGEMLVFCPECWTREFGQD